MNTDPFPHHVGEVFDADLLHRIAEEFPAPTADGWRRYGNDHEMKLEGPPALWGPATHLYFRKVSHAAAGIAELFGLPPLHMETVGGGYHLIPPGGYLDVHTDFSLSPDTGRFRRVNVLTFLNPDWDDEGGLLELWDANGPAVTVAPEFGTTVAFVTSSTSWHGHPKPAQRWRASVAAYFFTDEPPDGYREQSTVWHPNGGRHA